MEKRKVKLQCMECGKTFSRVVSNTSVAEIKCPGCKSTDIDIAE